MGRKYTKIAKDAFDQMQANAGLVLSQFDPEGRGPVEDTHILFPTTGGISVSVTPIYKDNGADVDNCPDNTKELKELTGWEVKLSTIALGMTPDAIKLALGAADISMVKKITPRSTLNASDFKDELWWVGDRNDGGLVAAKFMNVLSTGGLQLKTTKNGKGQLSIELMAHVSIDALDTVPVEFYSAAGSLPAAASVTPTGMEG